MCTRDHAWVVSRLWSAQGALIEVYSHTFDSSKEPVEVQGGIPTGLLLSSLASLPRLQTTRPTYCGSPVFWDEAVSQDDMETEFTFGSKLPTPSRQYTHFVTPEGTESHVHCCRLSDSTASFMCGESPSPSHVRAAVIYGQPSTAYLRNLVWKILLTDLKQSWRRDRGPEMVTTWRRAHVFSKDASAVSTGRENVAVCKQPAEGSGCLYCIVSLIWKRMASLGKRETDIKTREMSQPSAVLFERNKTGKGPPESPDPTTRRSAPQRKIYIVPQNLENIPANSEAHPAVVAPAIIAAGPATGRPACPAERKVLRLAPFLSCANKYAASFPTKPKSPPSSHTRMFSCKRIMNTFNKTFCDLLTHLNESLRASEDRERDWTRRAISIPGPCSETLGNADDYRVEPVHIDEVGPCAVPGQDQFSAVSLKETRQVNPGTPSATKRSKLAGIRPDTRYPRRTVSAPASGRSVRITGLFGSLQLRLGYVGVVSIATAETRAAENATQSYRDGSSSAVTDYLQQYLTMPPEKFVLVRANTHLSVLQNYGGSLLGNPPQPPTGEN
ncbi:hypothetical protein Bbelb_439570 [Branchiostoma belcheri]|nr:hypothetical protein Bbelb_439570 [Branchiostoma belcheri]